MIPTILWRIQQFTCRLPLPEPLRYPCRVYMTGRTR